MQRSNQSDKPDKQTKRSALCMLLTTSVLMIAGCGTVTSEPSTNAATENAVASAATDAQAVHERLLILDAHADIVPMGGSSRYGDPDGSSKVTVQKLRDGNVDAVVLAIAVGSGPRTADGDTEARQIADSELAAVRQMVASSEDVVLATSADELLAAHAQGRTALILGLQNARILQANIDALDEFYAAGVRVFALTHLGHNDFADSSRPVWDRARGGYEPVAEHGGLSELGRAAIRRINRLGGLIDISQLSKDAALQTIALSATPVIASHSNVRKLSQVARNLSDEEIDLIGQRGGVIHVAAFTAYLLDLSDPALIRQIKAVRRAAGISEQYTYPYELYWEIEDADAQQAFLREMRSLLGAADVDRLIDHIDYIVERIGIDHVGLSTDFNHGGGIEGFANAAEAANVTAGLLARGYTEQQIAQIWSGNFLRVLRVAQSAGR